MRYGWRSTLARCLVALLVATAAVEAALNSYDYFKIIVVDEETGRGVPLVELKTTDDVTYYTDSNGIVAFYEPGLMDQSVWFYVQSHGYEFPQDFLGFRGRALKVTRGGSAVVKIKRINIAERLYRITGEGIYRDSMLVRGPVPIKQPVLNGQVMGQDTVMATPYRGRIYWFWGDTNKPSYPLGHFGTAGATSEWPSKGGLDPSRGIDLTYFADQSGFSRPMCAFEAPGMKWIGGLMRAIDEHGTERLIAHYDAMKNLDEAYESGLLIFNDGKGAFDRLLRFDGQPRLYPDGRPFRVRVGHDEYYYFPSPYPTPIIRVKADLEHIKSPASYEGFTCLVVGSDYSKPATRLDRDASGRLIYVWKANTKPLTYEQQAELIRTGRMKPGEGLLQLRDIDGGAPVEATAGSVCWNQFRRRWVMIAQKNVGEVWWAEADTPVGPWVYAKKIVRHDHYTFYWPGQHDFFDQDGGRIIYFEGTYTESFSGNPTRTPRYNYNQIMYQLTLSDPRLFLPVPVYRTRSADGLTRYQMREGVESESGWDRIEAVVFFAFAPDRYREGLIPIFATMGRASTRLHRVRPTGDGAGSQPLFYALPPEPTEPSETIAGTWKCKAKAADGSEFPFILELRVEGEEVRGRAAQGEITRGSNKEGNLELSVKEDETSYFVTGHMKQGKLAGKWNEIGTGESGTWKGERDESGLVWAKSPAVVSLYEYRRADGSRVYSTEPALSDKTLKRSANPLCRVWRNPMSVLILDRGARPVPEHAPEQAGHIGTEGAMVTKIPPAGRFCRALW